MGEGGLKVERNSQRRANLEWARFAKIGKEHAHSTTEDGTHVCAHSVNLRAPQLTRWLSGWGARPLPRRLQVRARQVPIVIDAARKRSRVFLPRPGGRKNNCSET